MYNEKIEVRVTETGAVLELVVLSKRRDRIDVVLGDGPHSVRCGMTPTRNGLSYVGSVLGREIVYARSQDQVRADIERISPVLRRSARH